MQNLKVINPYLYSNCGINCGTVGRYRSTVLSVLLKLNKMN